VRSDGNNFDYDGDDDTYVLWWNAATADDDDSDNDTNDDDYNVSINHTTYYDVRSDRSRLGTVDDITAFVDR